MNPFDDRLSAYAGNVSSQIMAGQIAAGEQATAHSGDDAEWARPTSLWSVFTLLERVHAALHRHWEPALPTPAMAPPAPTARVAGER